MSNLLLNSLPDSCSVDGGCGFVAKVMSYWNQLSSNVQLAAELTAILVVFYVLVKLFSCCKKPSNSVGEKKQCSSGCSKDHGKK